MHPHSRKFSYQPFYIYAQKKCLYDWCFCEMFNYGNEWVLQCLFGFLNDIVIRAIFQMDGMIDILDYCIHRTRKTHDPNNWRPIVNLQMLYQVFAGLLYNSMRGGLNIKTNQKTSLDFSEIVCACVFYY